MTHYWDSRTKEVSEASERCRGGEDGDAQFLLSVALIEGAAVRAVGAVAKLDGFPVELQDKIARAIEKSKSSDALNYRKVTRSSELLSNLHSIFHDVASRKIQTTFGVLSDDPVGTLKRLNANGKDAFEDHIDTCPDCDVHKTLGDGKWCGAGETLEKQWSAVNDLMSEGVPVEEWPK